MQYQVRVCYTDYILTSDGLDFFLLHNLRKKINEDTESVFFKKLNGVFRVLASI